MSNVAKFDSWLTRDAVARLVIREHLVSVEGSDGVIFPATEELEKTRSSFLAGTTSTHPREIQISASSIASVRKRTASNRSFPSQTTQLWYRK